MKKAFSIFIIFASVLVSASGAIFSFNNIAQAQLAVPTFEVPESPVSTNLFDISANTTVTNSLIGLPGTSQTAIQTAKSSLGKVCTGILASIDTADKVGTVIDTSPNSILNLIGGGFAESSKLTAQIVKATTAKTCIDTYVTVLSKIPTLTLTMGQELQREQDKFTKSSESLRKIIEDLKTQQNASVKDVLKAFMVKLVLNLNKNLTTNLVNSMMQKYKIEDYLSYGNALATQVYSMKYINDNFQGDSRTQMMLRSLVLSDKFPDKIKTATSIANAQAKDFIASQCANSPTLSASDSASLNCLASLGSVDASPMFKYLKAVDISDQAKATGQATAQQEISQSNGYAPPRDCSGSIAQQQQIDTSSDQAANNVAAAANVLDKLKKAQSVGQTTQAEVDKAQAAYDAADKAMSALSNTTTSPVIDICKSIVSPASFVGDQLNNFLKQHLDQASQLKSDNLPFYATFLSDVASNFLTNLLTGGKSSSQVFKEAGLQALGAGVVAAPSIIGAVIGSSSSGSATFGDDQVSVYFSTPGNTNPLAELSAGKQYAVNVDISGYLQTNNSLPAQIVIKNKETGAVINQGNTSVSSVNVNDPTFHYTFTAPTQTGVFTIQLLDSAGKELHYVGAGFTISGSVKGVSTTIFSPRRSNFLPRG